ncbi:DUF2029 domain-containing protein [Candidatus Methanoplasma termitum]|uniref:DUF2029 domain-containing protein n=1 Tax=Candidatus Methanoplasma termitum TaxID=1577791 RepID=UPI0011DD0DE4|nr:DUF2029 domain-containing protein [Candidatus Methanoplasma termitum]
MNSMSSPVVSLRTLLMHPIFFIAVVGIAIRLIISPFVAVGYDIDYWAVIIRNIESGQGLYGLEGYYYTPVWGYSLSFQSMFHELFLNINVMGQKVPEFFQAEFYSEWWTANVTSTSFNFFLKIPFVISDIIVGYLIYWLIKDKTQDTKKATIGFTLWFLCPLIIIATSVSGMFDTFSILFALLCVVMVRKDKLFLAGILFSFAVLTKFFPAYFIFIILAYILVAHRTDGKAFSSILKAVAGAIIAFFVLMAPQIINGEMGESLLFITSRATSGSASTSILDVITNGAVVVFLLGIVVAAVMGYLLTKKSKEELDDSFFKYALFIAAFLFLYPPLPQYLVFLLPFLVIYISIRNGKFKWAWLLISIGGSLFILAANFSILMPAGAFTELTSSGHIMSLIDWFQQPIIMSYSATNLLLYVSGVIQYLGILAIMGLLGIEWYIDFRKSDVKIWAYMQMRFSLKRSKT